MLCEEGGGGTGVGEYGDAVAVFVGVDKGDCGGEGWDGEDYKDGAEDFFRVAGHVRLYVGDDGGTDLSVSFY